MSADVHGGSAPLPDEGDRLARVAWSRVAEPGDPIAAQLIDAVGAAQAWAALQERTDAVLQRYRARMANVDVAADLERGRQIGARLICPGDPEWPAGLTDLPAPPYCLWVIGPADLGAVCARSVAVVGARSASRYGQQVAADLAAGLAERGFAVVSGAAYGIDAAAHRGALAVDGTTIAVLAGGVDRPYPAAHTALLAAIAESGAVVSEVPVATPPIRSRFLLRNRLIATVTQGTVVVEAGLRSGARNTAATAAQQHRVVAAVPGPVTSPVSAGCHEIIRSGQAILVTDAAEVAEVVGEMGSDLAPARVGDRRAASAATGLDETVMRALRPRRGLDVEELALLTGAPAVQVRACLGRLELSGAARRSEGVWRRGVHPTATFPT